jgi:hypothetical protein
MLTQGLFVERGVVLLFDSELLDMLDLISHSRRHVTDNTAKRVHGMFSIFLVAQQRAKEVDKLFHHIAL